MTEISVGNLVRLSNIAGPKMIVVEVTGAEKRIASCIWFNANGDICEAHLLAKLLSKTSPEFGWNGEYIPRGG